MVMESEKPRSKYGQWIIGLMLVAYLATSFDPRHLFFRSPLITVGSVHFRENKLKESIREAKAYCQLMLISSSEGELYFLRKVLDDAMWDQEVKKRGIQISEEKAKKSLREKMCFLDESGRINRARLSQFYQKNPTFLQFDSQLAEDTLVTGHEGDSLFRGNPKFLDPEDRFQQSKMDAFLRNNQVTLLQMIAVEQRALGRLMLKRALIKNMGMPTGVKEFAETGSRQRRSWRSKFFPLDYTNLSNIRISEAKVKSFAQKAPKSIRIAPEMRTFSVMQTPDFSTTSPTSRKYTTEEFKILIQDAVGAGKGIQDVAKEHKENGWTAVKICSSVSGKGLDFAPISWKKPGGTLPTEVQSKILEGVFSGKEGDVFNIPVMLGGMAWVQIQSVQESRPLNDKELFAAAEYQLKIQQINDVSKEKARDFEQNIKKKEMQTHTMRMGEKIPEGVSVEEAMYIFQMTPPPVTSVVKMSDGYMAIDLTDITTEKAEDSDGKTAVHNALDREWISEFLSAYEEGLKGEYPRSFDEKAQENHYLAGLLGIGSGQAPSNAGDGEDEEFQD